MKALSRIVGLAAVAVVAGCEPIDGIDLGGGGTGGGAFSRGFVFVRGDSSSTRNVFAVDDSGDPNSPLQLTTQGGAFSPTVSRNGRQVAFVHRVGSVNELQVVPTTGQGQPSTVFSSTSTSACSGCTNFRYPTFSPDGRTIVFTLDRSNASTQLARVNADGTGFQLLPNSGGYFFGPTSFTADGLGLIAAGSRYSKDQLEVLLYVNVLNGLANVVAEVQGADGTAQVVVSRVAVSPDGSKVAFDARTSSGSRIFVGTIDGQQQVYDIKQVTGKLGVDDTYPSWRGNTELGFLSNEGGTDNIYRVSASSVRGSGNLVLVVPKAAEPSYGG
ncbi:LpqB family beta-propeller domain-containing protein [Vitiosangium sp. GDMCC 1.1324]|uniref:LpqB family beta-propeller domain-containing protein n=1 Tax=Vitiosangium sp. (strain GDMCC 1.1324) TaxID=2138576 RepID=UPI000D3D7AA0|nr:LpqB family beta-propeller domain-containing protein [Vitiosangium sp. GDMCC 1.1324]PTL84726.1 hypothetical protein DAT35_06575 [Vitiosangium sp. GDMCC 1.1324]